MSRLPTGGLIDRGKTCRFRFDGKTYQGYHGDTLASALLANDVRLVGRSFKYHRPRGLFTADSSEPNGLAQIGDDPNVKMTTVELHDGLNAQSQNRWPSLKYDALAVNGLLGPIFSTGFYYKTFMWPASFWEKVYEPLIRRAAGLGRLSGKTDERAYARHFAQCDLLVVGAGPAGLMAALTAARSGAKVILADEDFRLGGSLLSQNIEIDDRPASQWAEHITDELASMSNVTLLPRTAVFGVYDGGIFGALEKQPQTDGYRVWTITARHGVLATGAQERGIVFGGNDRPGVMLASAARTYIRRYAAVPGQKALVFTSTDDGWASARELQNAGVEIAAVIDPRTAVSPDLQLGLDAPIHLGATVENTKSKSAHKILARMRAADGGVQMVPCDTLAVSGGWAPNIGLACHLGSRPIWHDEIHGFVPGDLPKFLSAAGSATGALTTSTVLQAGADTARQILEALGITPKAIDIPPTSQAAHSLAPVWQVKGKAKAFVDMQHDVTASDVRQANREGFQAVEHVKRYTTLGMATDQGRNSNLNGLAILADARKVSMADAGLTSYRPPYVPVPIGAFAGEHRAGKFRPTRYTPSHDWAAARGAVFVDAGQWKRAQYFVKPGETHWRQSVDREALSVRTSVGFCDVSTLGKIDVFGPDAGVFLEKLYINGWQKLAVGKARYGLMLREDGFVMDDGTTSRLRDDFYMMTTTTAQAGRVFQHMKYVHQCLWPDLDVHFVSVTDQWAQLALAGPKSRDVLRQLTSADVSNEALPYMGAIEADILGVPGRIYRLSFSGELAYEVAVPTRYGEALCNAIMDAGATYDICPYGTEALSVLRIEKGHAAGPELNGQTSAFDLGLGRMMSKKKDFIGRKMGERAHLNNPSRPTLVGLKAKSPQALFQSGAHLMPQRADTNAANDLGHVSSAAYSPNLQCHIALGLVEDAENHMGETLRAVDLVRDRETLVEVVSPHFIDPEGERLRV